MKNLIKFILVILVAVAIRTTLVEPYQIPSGSMLPTILIGDFVLVDKTAYGIKIPFTELQKTNSKYLTKFNVPKRGDIIVFKSENGTTFIKRVVGIPGDTVIYKNKKLSVEGKDFKKTETEQSFEDVPEEFTQKNLKAFNESNGGKTYTVLDSQDSPAKSYEVEVPENSYFVMGDNRDFSNDSRYWGFVPFNKIKGKATFVWFSYQNPAFGHQVKESKFRPKRIGTDLR